MTRPGLRRQVMVRVARVTQIWGRTGWLGLVLCAVAVFWFTQTWRAHQADLAASVAQPVALTPVAPVTPPAPPVRLALARHDEQGLLLTQVQQVAVSQGLAWTVANYKLVPATESAPMALEVRCTLKGTYPRLRATLAQWLHGVPGLAIRDLVMSRPSSEVSDVEAKLQIVIFMSSGTAEAKP